MYPRLSRLAKYIYLHVAKLTWIALLALSAAHFIISWLALAWAGETELAQPNVYWYFYVTTGTTVGYGDFSPQTSAGRAVTALLVMPGGIALLTIVIGKLVQLFSFHWRKSMQGMSDYSLLKEHIVILGWHGEKTRSMVAHILGDKLRLPREIVLCAASDVMENPLPAEVKFLRDHSLSNPALLARAGIPTAAIIIALGVDDNETLAATLAATALNKTAHIVAYFENPALADILKAHCPHAECNVSLSIEMLVRSAQDPGSSRVHQQLLSTLEGQTQFSLQVPDGVPPLKYADVFAALKNHYDATLIGLVQKHSGAENLLLNAPSDHAIVAGDVLYFIAAARLRAGDIAWSEMSVAALAESA
jgi:voltage-gated potassium channel